MNLSEFLNRIKQASDEYKQQLDYLARDHATKLESIMEQFVGSELIDEITSYKPIKERER